MKALCKHYEKIIGIFLLTVFLVIGILTVYWRPFVDEADNLVTGWLLSQGSILYKDIFSHHFPFVYYWVALIVALFGKSIFVVRFSVLVFQFITFGIAIYFSRKWIPVGITALFWAIFRLFYRGHVVLYSSFSGAALFAVFMIVLFIYRLDKFPNGSLFTVATLSAIAVLSDPLSIYPILIVYIFIMIKNFKKGLLSAMFFLVIPFLYFIYLLGTETITDFWRDAIYFNQIIYSKYTPASAIRFEQFFEMILKGLDIFNPSWLNFNPLSPISLQSQKFDSWIFTGFYFRTVIILGAIFLVVRKEYWSAVFIYLFSAAALTISPWEFRAQPFILISLFITSAVVTGDICPKPYRTLINRLLLIARIMASIIFLWTLSRSITYLVQNSDLFSYKTTFGYLEANGNEIRELSCYSSKARLLSYPGGLYNNWFSDLKPISKYAFMWPWVAEIGLNDVIAELSHPEIKAIVIREEAIIWDLYDTRDYLSELDRFLKARYIEVEEGIFLSPNLANNCP